jgi:hypothetical protein
MVPRESVRGSIPRESIRGSIRGSMVGEGETTEGDSEEATSEVPPKLESEPELEIEEEEDEDLKVIENDSTTNFLYNPFELTTSRRKRIQV